MGLEGRGYPDRSGDMKAQVDRPEVVRGGSELGMVPEAENRHIGPWLWVGAGEGSSGGSPPQGQLVQKDPQQVPGPEGLSGLGGAGLG